MSFWPLVKIMSYLHKLLSFPFIDYMLLFCLMHAENDHVMCRSTIIFNCTLYLLQLRLWDVNSRFIFACLWTGVAVNCSHTFGSIVYLVIFFTLLYLSQNFTCGDVTPKPRRAPVSACFVSPPLRYDWTFRTKFPPQLNIPGTRRVNVFLKMPSWAVCVRGVQDLSCSL